MIDPDLMQKWAKSDEAKRQAEFKRKHDAQVAAFNRGDPNWRTAGDAPPIVPAKVQS